LKQQLKNTTMPLDRDVPVVSQRIQTHYRQLETGSLFHVGLLAIPGANRSEKKQWIRQQKKLQRKAKA
jgi:hypothetical protein